MAQLAIPLMALGGFYVIANHKKETLTNDDKNDDTNEESVFRYQFIGIVCRFTRARTTATYKCIKATIKLAKISGDFDKNSKFLSGKDEPPILIEKL